MSVFISHAHIDKGLAKGLKKLIDKITSRTIKVWHSSETRPTGGMKFGKYREQISERVDESNIIVVILSPQSSERPFLVWESGLAEGKKKAIVPLLFWMDPSRTHAVFEPNQCFLGDDRESIENLCGRIIEAQSGESPNSKDVAGWRSKIRKFLKRVEAERKRSDERMLFHDHFHNHDTAEKVSGRWAALWTGFKADGSEERFEVDTLRAWTDETRLRMVGDGAKGKPYPMEGVVSSLGQIALTYWSEGNTAICGTVLLDPAGADIGSAYLGTWQGFTAKDLKSKLTYHRGRVAMARMEEEDDDGEAAKWVQDVLSRPFDWIV